MRWRLDYGLLEYGPWDHKVWGLQTVKGSEVVKTEAWLPMPSPLMTRDTLYGWLESRTGADDARGLVGDMFRAHRHLFHPSESEG